MADVMRNVDTGRKARNIEPVWDYIEQKYRPENCASRFFINRYLRRNILMVHDRRNRRAIRFSLRLTTLMMYVYTNLSAYEVRGLLYRHC